MVNGKCVYMYITIGVVDLSENQFPKGFKQKTKWRNTVLIASFT